jgi:malate dehydrogenase (oxaloacetate-decarboxylating)
MDYFKESLKQHQEKNGKWEIKSKFEINNKDDLSVAYSPGVAEPCKYIEKNPESVYDLTMKGNSVAIVSDGSAVLGLGDIGPQAAIPVMEGKAILSKKYAGIDGVPIVLDVHDADSIVNTVKAIAPTFGGINLEDIKAPKCFEIEKRLQDIGIPVFHDDQHGTAIVLLAALINASKIVNKPLEEMSVVINGAGAAGSAIAKLLNCIGQDPNVCTPVKEIVICDSKGIISRDRTDLNESKKEILKFSNRQNKSGTLHDAIKGADCFIGVSQGNLINEDDVKSMAKDPIIFAMANPIPEIMPELAKKAGAAIVGTGRSDFANQVNNVLAFPGIFKGALEARAPRITESMKIAAARALANAVENPTPEAVIPSTLDYSIAGKVADAVKKAAVNER